MDTVAAPRPDLTSTPNRVTRRQRWQAHRWLRGASVRHGARQCYTAIGGEVTVGATADGVVHVKGTKRCGSVWACPLCAPVIREARAELLDALFQRVLGADCKLVFVTATASHEKTDALVTVREGVHASWRFAFQGRDVYRITTALGNRREWRRYVGMIRASDLTVGDNGWHPHIHAVLVFDRRATWQQIDRWLTARRDEYLGSLGAWGMHASTVHGWDVRKVSRRSGGSSAVARYVAKIDGGWGAGLELTRGDLKQSRGGRTAFQLLQSAATGSDEDAELFREYEEATCGKRLIVTGRKLAQRYGVDPDEGSDEELANADVADPFAFTWTVAAGEWDRLLRGGYVVDLIEHFIECATELRARSGSP